jgi:hypothetical protein
MVLVFIVDIMDNGKIDILNRLDASVCFLVAFADLMPGVAEDTFV